MADVGLAFDRADIAVIVWLVSWIRSWPKLPHRLNGDRLLLQMGSLRRADVPISAIKGVSTHVTGERLNEKGTANFVPIAFPNRIIELGEPQGRVVRYAVRVDDPVAFDHALTQLGIPMLGASAQRA